MWSDKSWKDKKSIASTIMVGFFLLLAGIIILCEGEVKGTHLFPFWWEFSGKSAIIFGLVLVICGILCLVFGIKKIL